MPDQSKLGLDQAKEYIDSIARPSTTGQQRNYELARDSVLDKLGSAFSPDASGAERAFLSFIGYPPVLDAVATLLVKERNYHRVQQALTDGSGSQLEIELLIRISDYLLDRDHREKALPNFIEPILAEMRGSQADTLAQSLYDREEQCARALALSLNVPFPRQMIDDSATAERYEKAVATWCPDHPFLSDTSLRNCVFAAVAVARCALSDWPEYRALALEYTNAYAPTYHLLHIMHVLANEHLTSPVFFNILMQSCSDFLGIDAVISCEIAGESWEDSGEAPDESVELSIDIGFPAADQERTFTFRGVIDTKSISLGPYLLNTQVTVPCDVELKGAPAADSIGDCALHARTIRIDCSDLVVQGAPRSRREPVRNASLLVSAQTVSGHADSVVAGPGTLAICCVNHELDYPLARYVERIEPRFSDPALHEKHRRLRRILSEFASHKRGRLAKYRDKIEHERVLRNDMGHRVLDALLDAGILTSDTRFYYIDPDKCDEELGISWHQLRQYMSSDKLVAFLEAV